jgi:plasmid stability protein
MKNITLAIDETLLDEVRIVAAKKGTTVNAMVRDYLTSIASLEDRQDRARRRIRELAEKSTAEVGPVTWKREDLYDR